MTTHAAVWAGAAGDDKPKLYWASDRRTGMADGSNASRFYQPHPKSENTEHLWVAGAGLGWCVQGGMRQLGDCQGIWDFCGTLERRAREDDWPERDQRPDWLVCDESGLAVVTPRETFYVRPFVPAAIGSGREYAIGACLALMPQVATARTDWASIVRRAVLVAGECDEGTEGVECGVWTPGPVVWEMEPEDVAVPA